MIGRPARRCGGRLRPGGIHVTINGGSGGVRPPASLKRRRGTTDHRVRRDGSGGFAPRPWRSTGSLDPRPRAAPSTLRGGRPSGARPGSLDPAASPWRAPPLRPRGRGGVGVAAAAVRLNLGDPAPRPVHTEPDPAVSAAAPAPPPPSLACCGLPRGTGSLGTAPVRVPRPSGQVHGWVSPAAGTNQRREGAAGEVRFQRREGAPAAGRNQAPARDGPPSRSRPRAPYPYRNGYRIARAFRDSETPQ